MRNSQKELKKPVGIYSFHIVLILSKQKNLISLFNTLLLVFTFFILDPLKGYTEVDNDPNFFFQLIKVFLVVFLRQKDLIHYTCASFHAI